jgi:hypothetical protein
MGVEAVKQLCERRGISPMDIDMLICATATPDFMFPATANIIADIIMEHQKVKSLITKEVLDHFFDRTKFKKPVDQAPKSNKPSVYTEYSKYGINFDLTFGCKPKGGN